MDIEKIQQKIDQTDYWDAPIYDFQINFFGDQVSMAIANDDISYWKICFKHCKSLYYESFCSWKNEKGEPISVCDMNKHQLDFFGQDITVFPAVISDFLKVTFNLSFLSGQIICREIEVEKKPKIPGEFFWE